MGKTRQIFLVSTYSALGQLIVDGARPDHFFRHLQRKGQYRETTQNQNNTNKTTSIKAQTQQLPAIESYQSRRPQLFIFDHKIFTLFTPLNSHGGNKGYRKQLTIIRFAVLYLFKTMDFDENRLYYSHQQLQRQPEEVLHHENEDGRSNLNNSMGDSIDLKAVRRHFREFLRT